MTTPKTFVEKAETYLTGQYGKHDTKDNEIRWGTALAFAAHLDQERKELGEAKECCEKCKPPKVKLGGVIDYPMGCTNLNCSCHKPTQAGVPLTSTSVAQGFYSTPTSQPKESVCEHKDGLNYSFSPPLCDKCGAECPMPPHKPHEEKPVEIEDLVETVGVDKATRELWKKVREIIRYLNSSK